MGLNSKQVNVEDGIIADSFIWGQSYFIIIKHEHDEKLI
jgi:hypothetical protein